MIFKKRIFYFTINLFLLVNIDIALLHNLRGESDSLQMKIESLLPQREKRMQSQIEFGNVRVLIRTNGFAQITHPEVKLCSDSPLQLSAGDDTVTYPPKEEITITPDDQRFAQSSIQIISADSTEKVKILSLERGCGIPAYRGTLELFQTAEGIVIVNELPLEEYLYAVVPSEMPASYEDEALKVQAVCARSYAYNQTRDYSYPEYRAHVDDSTSFQVYGNSREQDSTIRAVDETKGEVLWYHDQVATAYYYSTSSGKSASVEAWGTAFNEKNQYLRSVSLCDENGVAYEANLPWYRWKATISATKLGELLELNTGIELGDLQSVSVTERGAGEIAQQITVIGTENKIVVETENKIRRALGGSGYSIEKQDGTIIESTELLPSAFVTISKSGENYIIDGGGYGHGIGMSQNGANEMAKSGKNYREILTTFYTGVKIK